MRQLTDIGASKAKVDDANMAHAGLFKKFETIGIHTKAFKAILRLYRMEPSARADELRAFDQYRSLITEFDDQPDLLEEPTVIVASEPVGAGDVLDVVSDIIREAVSVQIGDKTEAEPKTNYEPAVNLDGDDFDQAGHVFNAGKTAGATGVDASENPYAEDTPSFPVWATGHAAGVKQRAAASAGPVVDEAPAAAKPKPVFFSDGDDDEDEAPTASAEPAKKRGRPAGIRASGELVH